MAKKKIIAKQEKPAKQERQQKAVQKVPQKAEKKTKKPAKQQQTSDIFTPQFYKKLDDFQVFYRQVLELKSQANKTDFSGQLNSVDEKVRTELQTASENILRTQLVNLEEWINSQQAKLIEQIQTVNKCLEQNRNSLQSTKAFTVNQITSQLRPIQQKIDEKQTTLDNYGTLLTRSKKIYENVTKIQPNQTNNNDNDDIDMNLE